MGEATKVTPDPGGAMRVRRGPVPRQGPATWFDVLLANFERARDAAGLVERSYAVGGRSVRLRSAGRAMADALGPALAHLEGTASDGPGLAVHLWDSASTGIEMPPPPWRAEDYVARGEIDGYNNGRFFTAFQHGSFALSMLDLEARLALYWVADAAALPYYERGSPLRTILAWWLAAASGQLIHAAAVGTTEGGVLLAGRGGSGKSTTALACLDAGLRYAGDDYVLLEAGPPAMVHSLYGSAKVDKAQLEQLPRLRPLVTNSDRLDTEKALILIHDHLPELVTRQLPVRALLLPVITGLPETRLLPASAATALTALAPSTIFQLPRAGHEAFRYLAGFVRQVPCHMLALGTRLDGVAAAIERLLGGHA